MSSCALLTMSLAVFTSARGSAATFTFQGLGELPGGSRFSYATGVSADGAVVVGGSISAAGSEAFRWTGSGGMVGLGFLPPGNSSLAWQASADGSSIALGASGAARWTSDGGLTSLGLGADSLASDVSADGSVYVGYVRMKLSGSNTSAEQPYRWTSQGGAVGLGTLPGSTGRGVAWSVSDDGSVVVGNMDMVNGGGVTQAFRWTEEGGMVGLGYLPGQTNSFAYSVSGNGLVIYGGTRPDGTGGAFRWTVDAGMVNIGSGWTPVRTSYDGSTVVGYDGSTTGASVWTTTRGLVKLQEFLIANGTVGLVGWKLSAAWDVSADGRTIVGEGTNPSGFTEAWIATIPEPASLSISSFGAAILFAYGLRRSARARFVDRHRDIGGPNRAESSGA